MYKDKRLKSFLQFDECISKRQTVSHKDITMERNNRKKYIHIDHKTGSNEISAMLENIESETEGGTEIL